MRPEAEVPGNAVTIELCMEHFTAAVRSNRCIVPLTQLMFVPDEDELGAGVCHAIGVDWIRRKLFLEKASFAVSKRGAPPEEREERTAWMAERLGKKSDRLVRLQQQLSGFQGQEGMTHPYVYMSHIAYQGPEKYWSMDTTKVARVLELKVLPRGHDFRAEGYRIMEEILTVLLDPPRETLLPAVRRGPKPAGTVDPEAPSLCFLVGLANAAGSGHAWGFEVQRQQGHILIQFMDPNLGEFRYDLGTERQGLLDLGCFLWNFYRLKGNHYDHLNIDVFTR